MYLVDIEVGCVFGSIDRSVVCLVRYMGRLCILSI